MAAGLGRSGSRHGGGLIGQTMAVIHTAEDVIGDGEHTLGGLACVLASSGHPAA
jgi:hypothetical protein